jgi:HlyD family secretion protein
MPFAIQLSFSIALMKLQFARPDERISGAAMDQPMQQRYGKRIATALGMLVLLLGGAAMLWRLMPHGLQVPAADVRVAAVERGIFHDDVVVRATAAPLHSVMLDAVESGRVEEVLARDGALVAEGELLFRLSNPQRHLDLLARESDRAQQISNLSNLRVALEASLTEHQRRMSDLTFTRLQAQKQHARNVALAQKGFISAAALDDSADRLAQQQRAFDDETASAKAEISIKRDAVNQMKLAIARMESGMQLLSTAVDALAVRASLAGRLTDFHLQVGETVKPDQHIGRIDDPAQFKLSTQIDEYYLNRVTVGRRGSVVFDGKNYVIEVSRVYPQIRDGRFTVELTFEKQLPQTLSPGQSAEAHITLGDSATGLLLPNDAFVNDSGGTWVFVVGPDGASARRQALRIGRRNNSQVEVLSGLAVGERVVVSSYAAYGKAERLQFTK